MFEQTFRNIDDVLWKEAGCATELDYAEQTSWMLFLKYLDDLEYERAQEAELTGKPYTFVIDELYRWSAWAAPKTASGVDLIVFVNGKLFPYLQGFRERSSGTDTLEYRIGEIFSEIRNKFASGYSLRDALELIDGLSFRSQAEKHELSHLYEAKIKNMGNATNSLTICLHCLNLVKFPLTLYPVAMWLTFHHTSPCLRWIMKGKCTQ